MDEPKQRATCIEYVPPSAQKVWETRQQPRRGEHHKTIVQQSTSRTSQRESGFPPYWTAWRNPPCRSALRWVEDHPRTNCGYQEQRRLAASFVATPREEAGTPPLPSRVAAQGTRPRSVYITTNIRLPFSANPKHLSAHRIK